MFALLFVCFSLLFTNTLGASKYYNLGSNRVTTWSVEYGSSYYNDLKFQIRLRAAANLVAYTWKNEGNCNTQYFLDRLNTNDHSVNIPYSNSMVVHPWTNGLGNVEVDARNSYCVGLHCHGDNTCYTEYDYYAADGCRKQTPCPFTSGGEFICERYLGCGCSWDLVWKCNQCWYGPCNCGYHHEACYCPPYCAPINKRGDNSSYIDEETSNSTILIQTTHEEEFLNENNYLIDKNISIDNCFQNNVAVYNKTYEQLVELRNEKDQNLEVTSNLKNENKTLFGVLIGLIIFSSLALIGTIVFAVLYYRNKK